MPLARWFRPLLRTLTSFIALVGVLGCALASFGWQIIRSDRDVERSRATERLDAAVDGVSVSLQQDTAALEQLLLTNASVGEPDSRLLPNGVIAIRASRAALAVQPAGQLAYLPGPAPPALIEPLTKAFADAEAAEFRGQTLDTAIKAYKALAQSARPDVRAGALARLARAQRKAGRLGEALTTYDELARLDTTLVFGVPAALQAIESRGSVLETLGERADLRQEALRLSAALFEGRYSIDRAIWDFLVGEAERWGADPSPTPAEAETLALSHAADWAFQQWALAPTASGRHTLVVNGDPAIVLRRGNPDHLDAIVAGPTFVRAKWTPALAAHGVLGVLSDENDVALAGSAQAIDHTAVLRTTAVPGLPWTIRVASRDTGDTALFAGRRRLLLSVFALLGVALVAGSFFIVRSITRKRAVARLQTEFVSAVSHEFRTPLSTLRQLWGIPTSSGVLW